MIFENVKLKMLELRIKNEKLNGTFLILHFTL